MYFWKLLPKIVPVGGFIVGWFGRAMIDRKITLEEMVELVLGITGILEIPIEIDLPEEAATLLPPDLLMRVEEHPKMITQVQQAQAVTP